MVQQIMPEQVPAFWEAAKDAIESAIPNVHGKPEQKLNNVLSSLLSGAMILWINFESEERKSNGLFITRVIEDDITDVKSLLMYCLHTYYPVSSMNWVEGWEAMRKYGMSLGCTRMVAYTDVPAIINEAKKVGGVTSYTFLDMPF